MSRRPGSTWQRRTWVVLATAAVACSTLALGPSPAAADAKSRTWLALGDSYSSGEGSPGTERPATGDPECARATGHIDHDGPGSDAKAWAVVAYEQVEKDWNFKHQDFYACTGNITDDLKKQISEAKGKSGRSSWDVVSLSFGGNNVDFSGILYGCLDVPTAWDSVSDALPGCSVKQSEIEGRIRRLVDSKAKSKGFRGSTTLGEAYDEAAKLVKPGGQVVVAGYPQLFEDPDKWVWTAKFTPVCDGLWMGDFPMLRKVDSELNNAIEQAVSDADKRWAARGVRFTYADLEHEVYETSKGRHARCTGEPWLNGLTTGFSSGDFRLMRSFHPTRKGHAKTGAYVAGLVVDGLKHPRATEPKGPVALPARFAKEWFRHGEGLTIRTNGTGQKTYRTYTEPGSAASMYYGYDTMRFSLAPGGQVLYGTVVATRYDDGQGHRVPKPSSGASRVGDTFSYQIKSTGALNERPGYTSRTGPDDLAYCRQNVQDGQCGA